MEDNDWTDLPSISQLGNVDEDTVSYNSSDVIQLEREFMSVPNNQDRNVLGNGDNKKVESREVKELPKTKQDQESCPICLSSFEDRSFLDHCFHSFCFCCILQWCEVVQTCPLCKSEFASLIHNVKSLQDYEQYIIEKKKETAKDERHSEVVYDERGFDEHGNRFRYRTTRHGNVGTSNTSHSQHSESRTARPNSRSLYDQHRNRRYSRHVWGDEARSRRHSRRRHRSEKTLGIEKRREVYAFNLRAISVSVKGKRKCRNISSKFYKANPACTHRLIPWLLRDLRVLLGNSEEEVNFLMEFILSLITRLDMDSSEFIEELRPFLLQTTEHFVHELLSFAKAPFDVNAYDECVVYPWPDDNNRVNVPGNTADISEERTGRFSQVELSELEEETSLALFDWSETPIEVRDKPGENESLTQVRTNENLEPSTISARETPAADGGKSHFTLTTRNNTSVSDVESQTVETSKRTLRDEGSTLEGLGNSVNGINDSVPGICVDNINLDSVQKNFSAENFHEHKHKRHKQIRHKRKHKHERTRSNHKGTALEKAREEKTSSRGNCFSVGLSNNVIEREEWIISLSSGYQTEEQPRSPTLEEMLKEISDLNARIEEHEQKLLSLGECAKR